MRYKIRCFWGMVDAMLGTAMSISQMKSEITTYLATLAVGHWQQGAISQKGTQTISPPTFRQASVFSRRYFWPEREISPFTLANRGHLQNPWNWTF
jgi:hypothetical protein